MLPVNLAEEAPSSPPGCNTVECKQRMTYMNSGAAGAAPRPPGLGLTKKDLPRQGSRDLVRRKAAVGLDDDGEPVYRLADYDEDEEEEGDNDEGEEADYDEDDQDEYYEGDEDDENDEDSLAKRHLPLLKGISVLGTPTFSRRSESFLTSLFRRKKKSSPKSDAEDKLPRKKKNKNKNKNKLKQVNKLKKNKGKGKGKLNLGGIDLMKGATIL